MCENLEIAVKSTNNQAPLVDIEILVVDNGIRKNTLIHLNLNSLKPSPILLDVKSSNCNKPLQLLTPVKKFLKMISRTESSTATLKLNSALTKVRLSMF